MTNFNNRSTYTLELEARTLRALASMLKTMPLVRESRHAIEAVSAVQRAARVVAEHPIPRSRVAVVQSEHTGLGVRAFRDQHDCIVVQRMTRRGRTWVPDVVPVWTIDGEDLESVRAVLEALAPRPEGARRRRRRGGRRHRTDRRLHQQRQGGAHA